jgi:hypothetical protein
MVGAGAWDSGRDHVRVADRLDLLDPVTVGELVEVREETVEQADDLGGLQTPSGARNDQRMTPLEGVTPPSMSRRRNGATRINSSSAARRKRKLRVSPNTRRLATESTSYPQGMKAATCSSKTQ